jgi:hypothetical protein
MCEALLLRLAASDEKYRLGGAPRGRMCHGLTCVGHAVPDVLPADDRRHRPSGMGLHGGADRRGKLQPVGDDRGNPNGNISYEGAGPGSPDGRTRPARGCAWHHRNGDAGRGKLERGDLRRHRDREDGGLRSNESVVRTGTRPTFQPSARSHAGRAVRQRTPGSIGLSTGAPRRHAPFARPGDGTSAPAQSGTHGTPACSDHAHRLPQPEEGVRIA